MIYLEILKYLESKMEMKSIMDLPSHAGIYHGRDIFPVILTKDIAIVIKADIDAQISIESDTIRMYDHDREYQIPVGLRYNNCKMIYESTKDLHAIAKSISDHIHDTSDPFVYRNTLCIPECDITLLSDRFGKK